MKKTKRYGRGIGIPWPKPQPTIQELADRIKLLESRTIKPKQ